MRDVEPEPGISCNQTKLPVKELRHHPRHITPCLQLALPTGYAGTKMAQGYGSGQHMAGPA